MTAISAYRPTTARHRVRYGGEWFSAASALPIRGGFSDPRRLARLLLALAARPSRAIALLMLLLRTPTVKVTLSNSAAGEALRDHFNEWSFGFIPRNRFCQGVLILPRQLPDYLRGRGRQAVRTNVRRAAAAGIWCETLEDRAEAVVALQRVMQARRAGLSAEDLTMLACDWPILLQRPDVSVFVAREPAGNPVGLAAVTIDDEVSLIRLAVASSHEARWSLHHHVVMTLIDRGLRYLVSPGNGPFGALGFTPDVQYYQRLLGYELRHVKA